MLIINSLDTSAVVVCLLATILVGLKAGINIKNVRDYAVGSTKFGTVALVLSFLATEVGGQGVINIAGEAGKTGIISIMAFMSFPLAFVLQGLFVAPKMVRFRGCITMGEVVRELYNKNAQVIVGIFSCVISMCAAGAELIVFGLACKSMLGMDYAWAVALGAMLLTAYVMYGGIRSVVSTDTLQFVILLIFLPVVAMLALKHFDGVKDVFMQTPSQQLQLWEHEQFPYYMVLFLCFGIFQFNTVDPALIQRMLMARSVHQLRSMFFCLAGVFAALFALFMLIGLAGNLLHPTSPSCDIVPTLIHTLLPTGIKGIMISGIILVIMASADSYLHAAGLALVHDIVKPLHGEMSDAKELRLIRYATLAVGFVVLTLGVRNHDNVYGLVFSALEFAVPSLVFPWFTGILGLKPESRALYASMILTAVVFVLLKVTLQDADRYLIPIVCVVTSGISFLTMHLVINRRFVRVNTE